MIEQKFKVKTDLFEGPLDVLLDLIEKRKMLINDISLAKVTDDFIAHIKDLGIFPMGEASSFILIASTLLLIKSKSLLPTLELTPGEQGDIKDLERRLVIYQKFKRLGQGIHEVLGVRPLFYSNPRPFEPVFSPSTDINLDSLFASINRILNNLPKKQIVPKAIVDKVISLEDMIEHLTKRVTQSLKMSFKEFSNFNKGEKVNVIVGFLAMLELVKQGSIMVKQDNHFEDIQMEITSLNIPAYN